ncbi:hypothetical protein C4D60_Mb09t17360 [Musa balbisiana]|uniref:Protein kinase domain-containing protein n=1 Tax=Musa balbisiana TaxID=52838 RepID=A0A4S8IH55_MUSBA|nr:hypothetical protein C4D60_Mb09t17360 [Musa balbisiana]
MTTVWQMLLLLLQLLWQASASTARIAREGCRERCGDVEVPYPFGMDDGCFLEGFDVTCNSSFKPPKLFPGNGNVEALSISVDGLMQINHFIAYDCYDQNGVRNRSNQPSIDLSQRPYKFSDARNKFVGLGCDTEAYVVDVDKKFSTGCASLCNNMSYVINGTCSGIGCCETSVPKGLRAFEIWLRSYYNHSGCWSFSPCSYAFLADQSFKFNASMFFSYDKVETLPVTLEWAIGNKTCEEARNDKDFACVAEQSECYESTNGQGYRCNCYRGYEGNPYLEGGCKDVNECEDEAKNQCLHQCQNTQGSYSCICQKGMKGDGRKDGTGCSPKLPYLQMGLGLGFCILFLVASISWLYWITRKRRLLKLREKFFEQNGGLLLRQQITPLGGAANALRIFTSEELQRATNNYDESRIIGKGGFGTVYKGVLLDHRVVAIKRSKISDEGQIEQFINEVVVLSNIIHRNVVTLLGCCLETEVPLLVYEFMSNGTLSQHLHDEGHTASLSLDSRLRIAAESAEALAYLHSSAITPIIHRDVKSSNILLDENYTAKVSDFGTSRLVPFDRSCLSSLVRGTFGYLDPEYFHTGQFTDKSDVYSFGVVLVELLTGERAITGRRSAQGNGNLSSYFVVCMNENRLMEILENRVVQEGSMEKLVAVAELAKRCLLLRGEERPTMKEVAMVLDGIRTFEKHPWVKESNDAFEPLLGQPLLAQPTLLCSVSGTLSERDSSYSAMLPLNIMR